ncbi:hypothetical protein [Streptosporangium jomthongense]|uniref:Uncharacterized protein n=1 Tax=Streptosporangium jomthongense TaxID=1193683 RepID=A0ABV8F926_9ACTN
MMEKHVAVMVPAEEVSPLWLWDLAQDQPVVELYVPVDGAPVLSLQNGDDDHRGREYRQRSMRWPIPPLVAGEALWQALAALRPLAARIAAWMMPPSGKGGPRTGLTADAQMAAAELEDRLAEAVRYLPQVEIVSAWDLSAVTIHDLAGADLTDEDLAEATARLNATVTPMTPGGVVVVRGLADRMKSARNRARARVRARLAIVAAMAETGRQERDELIRRIASWGERDDTHRSLGAAAGLSHGAVQKILTKVERDDALEAMEDRLAAALEALVRDRNPEPLHPLAATGNHNRQAERERRAQQRCAVPGCAAASRLIVKRWQIDDAVSLPADEDDPDRDPLEDTTTTLSVQPRFDGQPTWTACGTVHARTLADTDRANPAVTGTTPGNLVYHYQVETFRYRPRAAELPRPILRVRHCLELLNDSADALTQAVHAGHLTRAASCLYALKQDVARSALVLSELYTEPTPATLYRHGDPEPGLEVRQVEDGDTLYLRQPAAGGFVWIRRGDPAPRTWAELTASTEGRPLVAVPDVKLVLPTDHERHEQQDDDDGGWYDGDDDPDPYDGHL